MGELTSALNDLKAAIEAVYLSRARRYLPAFTCSPEIQIKLNLNSSEFKLNSIQIRPSRARPCWPAFTGSATPEIQIWLNSNSKAIEFEFWRLLGMAGGKARLLYRGTSLIRNRHSP